MNIRSVTAHKPYLIVLFADFNAQTSTWYNQNKATYEGSKINSIALQQLIHDSTHILNDSSSCIDLVFTSQSNLVIDLGVHSSVHCNCHQHVVNAKFSLKINYLPPPYEHEIWHYGKAKTNLSQKVINDFLLDELFKNLETNEMAHVFNKTIKNILASFIPH